MNTKCGILCGRSLQLSVVSVLFFVSVMTFAGDGLREEEVTLEVANARLAGTLSLPDGNGPLPGILLVCGSGDQDRRWDIDGDGRYLMGEMLADAFQEAGIGVLRLDDRGTGKSTGERESVTSFALLKEDVLTGVRFLREHPDIDQVGIGGFSAGAEIAVMASADSGDVDFLVLLSAPFVSGAEILVAQAHAFPRAFVAMPPDDPEELLGKAIQFQQLCIAASRGQDASELLSILRRNTRYFLEKLPEEERAAMDLDHEIEKQSKQIFEGFRSPWFQSFVAYDPSLDLPRVTCPILAIYGENDNRVTAENGWRALMSALSSSPETSCPDLTVRVLPQTNHFLTSREYALKGEMMPGLLNYLTGWALEKTKKPLASAVSSR